MLSLKDFINEQYNSLNYMDASGKLGNKSAFSIKGVKYSWIPEDKFSNNKAYDGLAGMKISEVKDALIETLELAGFKPYMAEEKTLYFLYPSIRDINKKSPAKTGMIIEFISDSKLTWQDIVAAKNKEYGNKFGMDTYDFNKHKKNEDGKYVYKVHFYFDLDKLADILGKPELLEFY